ncbi:MAG: hypothetical protein PVF85_06725 [Anaerolineales bacterium]
MLENPHGIVQTLITASLLLHAIAHAIALVGLTGRAASLQSARRLFTGGWLFDYLGARRSALILLPFWALAALAFFASAAASRGAIISRADWGGLAFLGASISTIGIFLAGGIWPGSPSKPRAFLNTSIAMVMNIIILSARLWLQWLPTIWIVG